MISRTLSTGVNYKQDFIEMPPATRQGLMGFRPTTLNTKHVFVFCSQPGTDDEIDPPCRSIRRALASWDPALNRRPDASIRDWYYSVLGCFFATVSSCNILSSEIIGFVQNCFFLNLPQCRFSQWPSHWRSWFKWLVQQSYPIYLWVWYL